MAQLMQNSNLWGRELSWLWVLLGEGLLEGELVGELAEFEHFDVGWRIDKQRLIVVS